MCGRRRRRRRAWRTRTMRLRCGRLLRVCGRGAGGIRGGRCSGGNFVPGWNAEGWACFLARVFAADYGRVHLLSLLNYIIFIHLFAFPTRRRPVVCGVHPRAGHWPVAGRLPRGDGAARVSLRARARCGAGRGGHGVAERRAGARGAAGLAAAAGRAGDQGSPQPCVLMGGSWARSFTPIIKLHYNYSFACLSHPPGCLRGASRAGHWPVAGRLPRGDGAARVSLRARTRCGAGRGGHGAAERRAGAYRAADLAAAAARAGDQGWPQPCVLMDVHRRLSSGAFSPASICTHSAAHVPG